LPGIEFGFAAGAAGGVEGADAAATPLRVPAAHALAAHLQLASDGGENHLASSKQAARLFTAKFKSLKIAARTNRRRHTCSIIDPATIVTLLCEHVTVLCEIQ
jgi:hypothetical protein